MKKKLFLSVVCVLTILLEIGFAQGRGKMSLDQLDTNSDGKISQEEFQNAPHRRGNRNPEKVFNRLDTDGDGFITQEEMQNRRGQRQGRGGKEGKRGQW